MKLLFLDIETAPNLAYVWKLFPDYIAPDQLVNTGYIICWSAQFLGEKQVYSASVVDGEEHMIRQIHQLLDEADGVVTYNGNKFDIPTLNKEFVELGLTPPAPYKSIDLYRVVKKNFKFASNKLDFVCQQLGLGTKVKHRGMELWKDCMAGKESAIVEMLQYNKQDVILLKRLYEVLIPWIKSGPNHSVISGELVCPSCGKAHYHRRGYAYTNAGVYTRYHCQTCGAWFRGTKSEAAKEKYVGVA